MTYPSAVRRLEESLDDPAGEVSVREPVVRAAAQATIVLEQTGNRSANAIVVQEIRMLIKRALSTPRSPGRELASGQLMPAIAGEKARFPRAGGSNGA